MARFLSVEWFDDVAAHQAPVGPDGTTERFVMEQVVHGTPDGDVRYRVVVAGGRAAIEPPSTAPGDPDITIGCDFDTAVAITRGDLASQAALLEGRLRVSGNLARIADAARVLAGLDPVPAEVRARTSF